jgi:peptide deformylase
MSSLTIRQYGDPVLKERTREVDDIDGSVASLVESMIETMYDAPGTGLAANQVGVQRRIFVYDAGDGEGAHAVINPRIIEFEGRIFQHELDHLDGILLVERLNEDQRKDALKILRSRTLDLPASDPDGLSSLFTR